MVPPPTARRRSKPAASSRSNSGNTIGDYVVGAGGIVTVLAGGTANGTTVSLNGLQNVYGSASGTVLQTQGAEVVYAGGTASGTVIGPFGGQYVHSGGIAIGTIDNGGELVVYSGGTAKQRDDHRRQPWASTSRPAAPPSA